MMQANLEFLRLLEGIRSGLLNVLMLIFTEFGNEIIVLGVVCTMYWCINKNAAYRLGISFFVSGMLIQALKITFHIERPWVLDPTLSPVEAAKPAATGYSFPSGHTQGACALYGTFFLSTNRKNFRILCAVIIFLVAFSRLYLGVHTPLDVLTSLVVSLLCVVIVYKLLPAVERGNSQGISLYIILGAISILICVYSYILAACGVISYSQINDCFKSGGAGLAFAICMYIEKRAVNFSEKTDKLWKQAVKLAVGIGVALVLKSLPKLIAENNLAVDFIRYFITVAWVLVIFPLIFSKFSSPLSEENRHSS